MKTPWYNNHEKSFSEQAMCSGRMSCTNAKCPHFNLHEYREAYCTEYICKHVDDRIVKCLPIEQLESLESEIPKVDNIIKDFMDTLNIITKDFKP